MQNQGYSNGFYYFKSLILRFGIKKGIENQVADHLSRLENTESQNELIAVKESFLDEQLFVISTSYPWYVNFVNYIVAGVLQPNLNSH